MFSEITIRITGPRPSDVQVWADGGAFKRLAGLQLCATSEAPPLLVAAFYPGGGPGHQEPLPGGVYALSLQRVADLPPDDAKEWQEALEKLMAHQVDAMRQPGPPSPDGSGDEQANALGRALALDMMPDKQARGARGWMGCG